MDYNEAAALCFAESNKDSQKEFEKDCAASIWVAKNRENNPNPNRHPDILAGFTSVGGKEWNKFTSGKFTKEEEWFSKKAYQIAGAVQRGEISDPTDGADHIWNPELDPPNDWNTRLKESDVLVGDMYYPETYRTKKHIYLKETLRRRKKRK